MRRTTHRFTPADRAQAIYRYVPFSVGPAADAVTVEVVYDRRSAVVDLGLFDAEGFRGWSGSERDRLVVSPTAATPGYVPGRLPVGDWRVVLGLHRIPASGVEVTVAVDLGSARPQPLPAPPPRPQRPPARDLPASERRRWLAADLHSHSVHSDGQLTLEALACLAAERGLDVLAVTDHNTVSHHPHLARAGTHAGIELLPGQEVTTADGHANCFGDTGWIDFREPADRWRDSAEQRGGLLSVNHPLAGDCAWRKPLSRTAPLVEAWHCTWDRRSPTPSGWWEDLGSVPVGGSDFHRYGDDALPGSPTTWVEVGEGGILEGLAAGRVALSAHPRAPVLVRHDGELVAVDAAGTTLVGHDGRSRKVNDDRQRLGSAPGIYRLVDDAGRTLAFTP